MFHQNRGNGAWAMAPLAPTALHIELKWNERVLCPQRAAVASCLKALGGAATWAKYTIDFRKIQWFFWFNEAIWSRTLYLGVMSLSWNFSARAKSSYEESKPSRAAVASCLKDLGGAATWTKYLIHLRKIQYNIGINCLVTSDDFELKFPELSEAGAFQFLS